MRKLAILLSLFLSSVVYSQSYTSFYPTSGASGLRFGQKVDINNNDVVVSSSYDLNSGQQGKVYVFNVLNNNLTQSDMLFESDVLSFDGFGNSLSIENQNIAVGAPFQDVNFTNSGSVYLYKKVNSNYQFVQKITSINNVAEDNFGKVVKIFNDRLYVSSNNSVYVFDFNGTIWSLTQSISIPSTSGFGIKIEVNNSKLVILSNTNNYSLHNYSNIGNSNQWIFESTQTLSNNEVGVDLKLFNNQLYIVRNTIHEVEIYDYSSNNWALNSSFNFYQNDQLYDNLVVGNDDIFIGASYYILQYTRKFPLLHYKKISNIWVQQPLIYSNAPTGVDDFFGSSLALDGDNLVVGCKGESNVLPFGKVYYTNTTLGTNDFDFGKVIIYPNPVANEINISNSASMPISQINIYQSNGQLVKSISKSFEKIDVSDLTIGLYFISIYGENGKIYSMKFSKK